MQIEQADVVEKLVEVHREYRDPGEYDDADRVAAGIRPLADLAGFDSDFIPESVRRRSFGGSPVNSGVR